MTHCGIKRKYEKPNAVENRLYWIGLGQTWSDKMESTKTQRISFFSAFHSVLKEIVFSEIFSNNYSIPLVIKAAVAEFF